jgi:hypothetical protein
MEGCQVVLEVVVCLGVGTLVLLVVMFIFLMVMVKEIVQKVVGVGQSLVAGGNVRGSGKGRM